ncbi:MAG: hypothetical protein V9G10_03170 [Candidatus Nanopelagicales bacterium]
MAVEEQVVVTVAGADQEEPESVREMSARAKGLLICAPVLAALGFLLGYPARRGAGHRVRCYWSGWRCSWSAGARAATCGGPWSPSQLTRGEPARALITSINNRVTPTGVVEALDSIAGQPVEVLIPPVPPRREATVSYRFVPAQTRGTDTRAGHARAPRSLGAVRAAGDVLSDPAGAGPPPGAARGRSPWPATASVRRAAPPTVMCWGPTSSTRCASTSIGDELRQIHWRSSARVGQVDGQATRRQPAAARPGDPGQRPALLRPGRRTSRKRSTPPPPSGRRSCRRACR